ncbi:MAG: hypothetical protein IJN36_02450, partial [Clostridia bacterium]|nr:hypothetical protein [Clostridia bacterium]
MNRRKIIAVILSAMLIIPTLPGAIKAQSAGFTENFEAMTVGALPQSSSYELSCFAGTGEIAVKKDETDANKYVSIDNPDEGFPVMIKCSFDNLSGAISAGARFRQSVKSDGNVIMQLMSDDTQVCSVETDNGKIVFRKSTGEEQELVEYKTDTWYEIQLEIVSNTDIASISVTEVPTSAAFALFSRAAAINEDDGVTEDDEEETENFVEEEITISTFTFVNGLRAIATTPPGFELDDIYVRPSGVVGSVEINGADIMSIPPEGQTQKYTYTATAFSAADEEIEASFSWSVSPGDNVTLNQDGEKAELVLAGSAAENTEYTLTATANGEVSVQKKVTVKKAAFDKIEIKGKGSISPALEKAGNTYTYTAAVYDEFGNEMTGENIAWTFSGEGSEYFSLDGGSGVLTLTKTADVTSYINIRATITGGDNNGKFAERKISLVDLRSYLSDETRRNAIKTYMDTALEFGKDIYLGTPRIADGINRDGEPIKWHVQSRDEVPLADMGNEWELLRTMIAYSEVVGDPYYKERAYELYKWTMEHDHSANGPKVNGESSGLIYWGSHKAVDMRTGEPTGDTVTGIGHYHEIEEKDMYFTPFYEIDPEMTAQIVKNIWMGHLIETTDADKNVIGWTDMMFNRHAEYTKTIDEDFQTKTWDNTDEYDDNYYLKDPFVRTKESKSSFLLAASEYISAAVELYNRTGDEKALLWAKRLIYRYANMADKKTGVFPNLTITPYGAHDIVDENGDLSFNTRPKWVDSYTRLPSGMGAKKYGDQLYVQFAAGMEEEGLLDGFDVEEHLPLPSKCCNECRVGYHGSCDCGCNDITIDATDTAETIAKKRDNKCRTVLRERIIADGAKALIIDPYYFRKFPWAYDRSAFAIMEV